MKNTMYHLHAARYIYPAFMAMFIVFFFLGFLSGCGTLANKRLVGYEDKDSSASRGITSAVKHALFDYGTLIPAAAALVFAMNDLDEQTSDWAIEHNPLFGSEECAKDASNAFRAVLLIEALGTAVIAPKEGGYEGKEHSRSKFVGVELLAMGVTGGLTMAMKDTVERTRPDESDEESFPSGHASGAFSYAFLANRNFDRTHMPTPLKLSLQTMNLCLAAGVSWARVEGNKHFPSDVLAGAALGHFVTSALYHSFFRTPARNDCHVVVFPYNGGAVAQLSFTF